MKNLLFCLMILLVDRAIAKDQWLCTVDNNFVNANQIGVCGVGTDYQEGEARLKALSNSMSEFKAMCALSSDCRGHNVTVLPARSECVPKVEKYDTHDVVGFTCYRLIIYTIH